jgi:hypothetical protein
MSKWLTTICLILGSLLPIAVDTGNTHLFNPDWDEHSRVHEVWRLTTNLFIAIIGLYILWKKDNIFLPAILSSCIILGFHISVLIMPLYDGLSVGNGIEEPNPLGIPLNIFVFSVLAVLQILSFIFLFKNKS